MLCVPSIFLFLLLIFPNNAGWSWNFPHLSNLGDEIRRNVKESVKVGLKPVYEMKVRLNMEKGRGGTTVVTYRPDGRTLIVKEGRQFECPGSILYDGTCSNGFEPFEIRHESDKCFKRFSSMSVINGQVCLSDDSISASSTFFNGLICSDGKGRQIKPMNLHKFQEMCKNFAETADYKYVTYKPIGANKPKDVLCLGSHPTVCTFSSKVNVPGGGAGHISVQNNNSFNIKFKAKI